jgi:hypothetical protein
MVTFPADALQTPNRTTFEAPPQLTDTAATFNSVRVWGAKYYFSLVLPEDAGEPLKIIEIEQLPAPDKIEYELDETFAFVGTRSNRGESLSLNEVELNEETNTISITFDPPIQPGTAFTIGLEPLRNPAFGGTYLFRVRVLPAGNLPCGLDLGVGRLQFYENHDFR